MESVECLKLLERHGLSLTDLDVTVLKRMLKSGMFSYQTSKDKKANERKDTILTDVTSSLAGWVRNSEENDFKLHSVTDQ